jgi:uncharacterized membrane protein
VPQIPSATTQRLEAFSDGVIAIAITLLVLNIKVPNARSGQLLDSLANQWPSYVAFVLSFVVIGIMWVSHHSMFERIAQVDRGLLFVNLTLLLGIAFLPFPTSLLANYVQDGGSDAHIAAAVYSATMALIGVAFVELWRHLIRHPNLLVKGIEPSLLRRSLKRSLVSPIVYGLSIGLAFISAAACFVVYALVAIYFAWGPSSRILHLGSHSPTPPRAPAKAPAKPKGS